MPINLEEIRGQTITDIQVRPFSGTALLPTGATATSSELVIVLGNGRTYIVAGGRLSGGAPRLFARLAKTQQVVDSEVTP